MKRYIFLLFIIGFIVSCKHKKHSLSGDEPVEISDFIEFFPEVRLPYLVADSLLMKKEKDSLLISNKIFSQFVPDSLLAGVFGKAARPKIFPLGKVVNPGAETYLFVKTISGNKRASFIIGFDKKQNYIAGMPVLKPDLKSSIMQSVIIDRKFTITKTLTRKNLDGSTSEGKDVYVLNSDAKNFMLIMTDALDDKLTELINPIDTVSRKNKLAADYSTGKMNLVSIRDGRKNDRLSFFIHFEKNNAECTGELKGEAIIKSPTLAEYNQSGDPCKLKFIFTTSSVTVKEEECGTHRGVHCSFDASYPRKKYIKPGSIKKRAIKK